RDAEAAEQFRTNLALLVRIYGESHIEVAQSRVLLAGCLVAQQRDETRREAATLLETAKVSLEDPGHATDAGTESSLGRLYLERATLRSDTGDIDGARADVADAMRHLKAPADAHAMKRARALDRKLSLRA
ncbi:MAG: hypothetical protein ABW186_17320, partial [Rhodanobacteraceae bacterium]